MSIDSDDHIRLLKSLISENVKFIIIGGHAAILHGVRRSTADLDILMQPTRDNGARLMTALKKIGLDVPEINPEEFEAKLVLTFGLEPDAVDILTFTPGVEFDLAFENATTLEFEGERLKIIHLKDLIKNKEQLNRQGEKALLDQYDVAILKKILDQENQRNKRRENL